MAKVKADDIAVFKRKKQVKRDVAEKPLSERVAELEKRVERLEKLLKKYATPRSDSETAGDSV